MDSGDWRALYASNQAEIRRAFTGGDPQHPSTPPTWGSGHPTALSRAERVTRSRPAGPRPLIHVPRQLDPRAPAPLVCLLHGCTQDPTSFAAATMMNDLADRHGFVVVYPAQDRGRNPQGCWNWFLPAHQRRGAGEPAAIVRVIGELIEANPRCTVDARRVYVAGLSAGGAMAAILGACYPDLFAAVGIHSGLAYRSATDVTSAFRAMGRGSADGEVHGRAAHAAGGQLCRPTPSIVIHGSADRTVAPANARAVLRQSMIANHLAAPDRCNNDVARPAASSRGLSQGGYSYLCSRWTDDDGALMHELLEVDGLGHAWSGGVAGGSYTDPRGPSASQAIWTFFDLTDSSGER